MSEMTENKERTVPSSDGGQSRKPLSKKSQKRRTLYAAVVMLIPFSVFMYMIFGGKKQEPRPENVDGYNVTVPDGRSKPIVADKRRAYEKVRQESREGQQVQTVAKNPFLLLEGGKSEQPKPEDGTNNYEKSQAAYREATRRVHTFYKQPDQGRQIDSLRRQVADLTERLESRQASPKIDPLEMVERSYELASRYMGHAAETLQGSGMNGQEAGSGTAVVCKVPDQVVSALPQPVADSEVVDRLAVPRNYSFNTAVGSSREAVHMGIRACVAEDQQIAGGGRIKIRLLEPMTAGGILIPANAEVFGTAAINGQRMSITVTSIERGGSIIPVELTVHDLDGQPGLFVPNTAERTAMKEAAANVGSGLGSSVSFTRSAGQQVAMDVVRGVMTGGTQYLAAKLRETKVFVKANYQLLLIPTD